MIGDGAVAAARQCLGTPFRHQGRVPGVGLDCLGLILHVGAAVGCPLAAPRAYAHDPAQYNLLAGADANHCLERVRDLSELQAGDILMIRVGAHVRHMAIYTGGTMIHVWGGGVNKVCEHGLDLRWRRMVIAAYRFDQESVWL